jgi:hypothetical protein
MELIARIDCDGRTYIGLFPRDAEWVNVGKARPVTIVRNEDGGQNVTVEDIEDARSRHKKGYNGFISFADFDVKHFWDNAREDFLLSM